MPDLYIISGSNGAGKSTIGQDYVPAHVLKDSSIFDGDKLYMQKHLELWKAYYTSLLSVLRDEIG